jgi:tRNA(Ile)-lysidine synthase
VSELLKQVEAAVTERHLLGRGQTILAAVSGGVDSMVLLHLLHALAPKHRWQMVVAHFNHRLRGRASDADERMVRRTADRLGWPCVMGEAKVREQAAKAGLSIEMAARKSRHEFLAQTARRHRAAVIALAHHADDQVELFFLRLLRGTGGEGLAGMKWRGPSPVDPAVGLARPLLDVTKQELLAFARENHVEFREDATNAGTDILRNRIRHQLLPLLRRRYQPAVDSLVLRLMEIAGAEGEFAGEAAKGFRNPKAAGWLSGRSFDDLPLAVQRKVVQQQLTAFGLLPDFELIEQLRREPDKRVSVCAGLWVARDAAGELHCQEDLSREFDAAQEKVMLSDRPGGTQFGGRGFRWRLERVRQFRLPAKRAVGRTGKVLECFDANQVGGEILLRHWRPGDRFQPIGLKGAAKLQDLFVNARIPAARRRELVLATTKAGEIFWVEGLRIGERFKLTPETRRKLVWHVRGGGQ